jgi:enoyl-CoA hydratase/carnithine racemase
MSEILSKQEGNILVLSFNRGAKMNALTRSMYSGLATGLNDAAGDFGIRAVILTSEDQHFTAGNDISDFMNNPPTSESSEVSQFLESLLNFPKPLIAAVKGNAVGVGTTMLLHCDVVVASPTAKFSMPFASLGLVPEAGSSFLFPQLVGYQRAARIFMTGESFDAPMAVEMGLVTSIESDPIVEAMKIAQQIAEQPPQAEFEIFAMALQSEEAMESFMKFMSKKGK